MQVTFNTRKILPTAYEGKNGIGFNTTIFSPVQYGIRFGNGVMPVEQMSHPTRVRGLKQHLHRFDYY